MVGGGPVRVSGIIVFSHGFQNQRIVQWPHRLELCSGESES